MSTAEKGIEETIGDPREAIADLAAFEADNRLFSSRRSELMKQYSGRWIALFDGEVRADAATLDQLLASMDDRGLPRQRAVIRHMVQNNRRMILQGDYWKV